MKATKPLILMTACLMPFLACNETGGDTPGEIDDPITISSPTPTEQITKVTLTPQQQGYVKAGNRMAFRLLHEMYGGEDLICSPLSLQYALAMTANGASGETLQEIIDFLGYGEDGLAALNAYSKTLLEQLPAVDLSVSLKLADALLVKDEYPLLPAFQKTVTDNYYAAVENMPFTTPAAVAARINDWASRNTDGFIKDMMSPNDINPDAVACLMNALYFKAKWAGSESDPMFNPDYTKDGKFTRSDGSAVMVPMMPAYGDVGQYAYAEMDGYKVLALPYAGRKFFMYILLPDANDIQALLNKLPDTAWNDITASLKKDAEIYIKLPKFEVEQKYNLVNTLKALGVRKAFNQLEARFPNMFDREPVSNYCIDKVFQKAHISVAEWGTEAAAVTVVLMYDATSPGPGEEPKIVHFYADHPFAFVIGEASSGTILFEGVYTGK